MEIVQVEEFLTRAELLPSEEDDACLGTIEREGMPGMKRMIQMSLENTLKERLCSPSTHDGRLVVVTGDLRPMHPAPPLCKNKNPKIIATPK